MLLRGRGDLGAEAGQVLNHWMFPAAPGAWRRSWGAAVLRPGMAAQGGQVCCGHRHPGE